MYEKVVDKVIEEMKANPMTLLLIAALGLNVWGLKTDHVSTTDLTELRAEIGGVKEEVKGVKEEVSGVKSTLQYDHLDSRLHSIEKDTFDLTQKTNELKSKNQPVDRLYAERLNALAIEKDEIVREMGR